MDKCILNPSLYCKDLCCVYIVLHHRYNYIINFSFCQVVSFISCVCRTPTGVSPTSCLHSKIILDKFRILWYNIGNRLEICQKVMARRRKKRELKAAGKWWSESQRIEAVTTWLALGSIPLTAAATSIPKDTLNRWKYSEWWKDLVQQIRNEETLALDGRLSKIVDKALKVVEDRLDHGNFQYDQKSGEVVRVPVNLRDSMKATADLMDRREILRKQPQTEQIEKTVDDRLAKLAEEFARFSKAKDITPKPEALTVDIIEK